MNKARLLLVDDNDLLVESLSIPLRAAGYDVHTCSDGEAALQMLGEVQPDIVVIDLLMPRREGIETIIEIRRSHAEIGIIAMSGMAASGPVDFLRMAGEFGADAWLRKPFTPKQLIALIEDVAARRRPAPA
ncbi:MAG: response regulator [Thalassobaculales bacterium]